MKIILTFILHIICKRFYMFKVGPHDEVPIYKIHHANNNIMQLRRVVGCKTCLDAHSQELKKLIEAKNPLCFPKEIPSEKFEEEENFSCEGSIEENAEIEVSDANDQAQFNFNLNLFYFLCAYLCVIFMMYTAAYYRNTWIVRQLCGFLKSIADGYKSFCIAIQRRFESEADRDARELREILLVPRPLTGIGWWSMSSDE